jgi:hypothetical protein
MKAAANLVCFLQGDSPSLIWQIAQSLSRLWARVATFYDPPDILEAITAFFNIYFPSCQLLAALRPESRRFSVLAFSSKRLLVQARAANRNDVRCRSAAAT